MDVRLPNGVVISNVPEGATREEVFAKARAAGLMSEVEAQPPEPPRERGSLLDPIMQGLTLGFAEELGGAGAMLGRLAAGAPYERAKRAGQQEISRQRERLGDIRERMPWTSLGAEMTGAVATGAPLARGLMTGLGGLGLGRISAPIGAAGIEGGIAGAGAAEENRVLGATLGATLGAGTAGAMPLVGAVGRYGAEKATPLARKMFERPTTTAARVMSETLQGAGETPTRMAARQRQLGPQAALVDIAGPSGTALGQGVIQADPTGQAVTAARREMARRAAGSTARLREDLQGITGVRERLKPSLDAVRARQRAASEPAYAAAYNADISLTPKLKNLLDRPPMQRAWNEAREAAATRGEELPPFFQLDEFGDWQKTGVMPDMRAWDRMKQGIDRIIESETDAITGRVTQRGRDLVQMKNELVTELDEINPAYRTARNTFAGDEAIQNAMRDGERFLNMKTREVTSAVEDMTDSERQSFLVGAMEAIREKMGRARSGEIGEFRFLEQGNTREKLRAIFPRSTEKIRKEMRPRFPAGERGDQAFERAMREIDRQGNRQLAELMRTLDRERTFATTQGALVGGSQTALRQAAGEAIKSGAALPTTMEALTSPGIALLQAGMRGASEAVSGLGQRPIAELGQLIFDPRQTSRAILEMQRRGISPPDMSEIMARYARGGAMVSPVLGLGAGEMVNQ